MSDLTENVIITKVIFVNAWNKSNKILLIKNGFEKCQSNCSGEILTIISLNVVNKMRFKGELMDVKHKRPISIIFHTLNSWKYSVKKILSKFLANI